MSKIFKQLLKDKGFSEEDLVFKYDDLEDPFLMPDMELAVERIIKAIGAGEKILIYGDYDVDGVTAAALMCQALEWAGARGVEVVLPDRFEDGYGMSTKIVQQAKELGVNLVITVDCGSSNQDIVEKLREVDVDTIITDHHELLNGVPESAVAVVNPKRKDVCLSTKFNNLAGVGVAFLVTRCLVKKGFIPEGKEKWLMDLVAIGTVADRMVMRGENWRMCKLGFLVIEKTRRIGLLKLMKVANLKNVDSQMIGFGIAPRLNASGRMESAKKSLNLLLTKDRIEADFLANELNELNNQRKKVQKEAIDGAKVDEMPVIVVKTNCHEGVIGIVAGRLLEKYKKPVFVFTETGDDEQIKCSGRSFGEFNLGEALKSVEDLLIKGGGHAAACGATILSKNFNEFRQRVNRYYSELGLVGQEKYLDKQADLEIFDEKIDLELADEIARLEPFGNGNEMPIFLKKCVQVRDVRLMGVDKNHLSFMMDGIKSVWFYAPEEWLRLQDGERVSVWFSLNVDEWNGIRRVTAMVERME